MEVAAELHDMVVDDLRKIYPELMPFVRIRVIELQDHVLSTYDREISKYTAQEFSRHSSALPCPALPCPALPCSLQPCTALPCTAPHCTKLQNELVCNKSAFCAGNWLFALSRTPCKAWLIGPKCVVLFNDNMRTFEALPKGGIITINLNFYCMHAGRALTWC